MKQNKKLYVLVLTFLFFLGMAQEAYAFGILDPNELFYITGNVNKTEISQSDVNAGGRYELSYDASIVLTDLLGKYITNYSKYVTEFSFRVEVSMTPGLELDIDTVLLDCSFGEASNVSVAGHMMYMDVILKQGTALGDYSYEQWVTPIKLYFDAELSGEAFSVGDRVTVSLDVIGSVSGKYPLLGEQYVTIHGAMDPDNGVIATYMKASSETNSSQTSEAMQTGSPLTKPVENSELDNLMSDIIHDTVADAQTIPDGQTTKITMIIVCGVLIAAVILCLILYKKRDV